MATIETRPDEPGRYLTDGLHLFRLLVPPGHPPHGGFVELEDAATLERVLVRVSDLRQLRRVTTARRLT
jgi:hypothetical protein